MISIPEHIEHRSLAVRAGRFFWGLAQMVVAMKVGMLIYHLKLETVLEGTEFAALHVAYPVFGHWMMVVSMAVAMIAFMRYYHGSTWQFCGEMTIAMLIPAAVPTLPALGSLVPIALLERGSNWLMIPAMAALMLYRGGHHLQAYPSTQKIQGRRSIPGWIAIVAVIALAAAVLISLFVKRDAHDHHSSSRDGFARPV